MPNDNRRRYTARYIFPGDSEPVENGTVEIVDGRIAAVHPRRDSAAEDLGNAAIIPGLVNAHTHLEFSDLASPISPAAPFADWIRGVVQHRRERSGPVREIIHGGIAECSRNGTTLIGEIATDDQPALRSLPQGPRVCVFRELLGFGSENVAPQLEAAERFLDSFSERTQSPEAAKADGSQPVGFDTSPRLFAGLSPHAPYSVHPELFTKTVQLAAARKAPIAVHLAETREERRLLHSGDGPLAEMLREFGVWRENVIDRRTRPLDYLQRLDAAERVLIVHGNYLDAEECEFLAKRENISLVFCPRTHSFFQHAPHPWSEVQRLGGNATVGTDSRASNPDLSLWEELCFLRRFHPEIPDAELLRLGTINGALAMGRDDVTGSLSPGKSADLAVVRLQDGGRGELFDRRNCLVGTMVAGEWLVPSD